MSEGTPGPDLTKATAAVTGLAAEVVGLREDVAAGTAAAAAGTAAANRRTTVWGTVIAVVGVPVTLLCVFLAVVVAGALGDIRANQETIRTKVLSDCGQDRTFVGWPGLVVERARTAGRPPIVDSAIVELAAESRSAYERAGCEADFGPLPPPVSFQTAPPTVSPSTPGPVPGGGGG